jgi:hypothetical protein
VSKPDLLLSELSIAGKPQLYQAVESKELEETLQRKLFILRKLNASLGIYRDALLKTEFVNKVRLYALQAGGQLITCA